ncbi:SusC/RagA family TonB-linked outer membrane protein [Chitinophaga sp. CB10]|uniref:SusC/RagA family TonB-linked outer membrane protein n=1 Tax=Chitinophaga sp. CB10 TaxID=1891659 RepID=UPI0025B9950F|nr:SusC/RagA family TonB-linked outer membrane protein [Chitinophaga sp. CB10]
MKINQKFLCFCGGWMLLLFFIPAYIHAQQHPRVTGAVLDEQSGPIPGVNVIVRSDVDSTQRYVAVTDTNGIFVFTRLQANNRYTFSFSHIGFESQSLKSLLLKEGENNSIMVKLSPSRNANLNEVIVVGYGTQKKVNLTGSVAVVDGVKLQNRPVSNVSQALYGTVPGVTISYGNRGFEPGAAPSVQIRGQGSPYVLIDGTAGDINTLDPNTIESISVLKDAAAAAIYGARAPYGVLLITTKSGKHNQKPQVDFSANGGPTTIIRKPRMVDSYTFARAINEMHDNQGVARLFAESTIDRIMAYIKDPSLPETVPDAGNPAKWSAYQLSNGNNDWIDIHFGNGFRTQENISLRGGSKEIAYFLSAGHASEKGPLRMVDDKYHRYNLNAKLDANINSWWKISSNTRIANEVRDRPIYNGEGGYGMIIHQIFRTHPEVFLKSPNGYYSQLSRVPQMRAGYEKFTDNNLLQRIATEIKPLKNWTINADYSIDYTVSNHDGVNLVAYEDQVDGTLVPISLTVPSYISKDKANKTYKALNIFSTYKPGIGKDHQLEIMAGFQQESNNYDYLSGLKRELITSEVPSITTATGDMQAFDDLSHWSTMGYFARLNYNYKNKYLLESNVRYDGTSKFADGKRWGFFPSVSGGWNVSQENFWRAVTPYVPYLKLKASWGMLGNQNVSAYQDLALIGVNTNLGWIINGKRPAYTGAPNLINRYLTWESSKTTNIGIDLGFFQNKLQVEFEYYQRLTFDRLGPAKAQPLVLGAAIPQENNSELKTRGWDLGITYRGKAGNDFSYSIAANVFDYFNVVTKYPNPTGILTTDYAGKRAGEIWGYETVGLIQTQERADAINAAKSQNFINGQLWRTGDVEYRDLNGDKVINNGKNTVSDHGDLRVIGNSTSRYQFGLNLSANYKNFDIAVFFQGTGKRDLWLSGNIFWGFNQWNQSSLFPHHLDYYRDAEATTYSGLGVNTDAYFPRPYSNATQYAKNQQVQTRYLQNGAYARLKNAQVGYNLPATVLHALRLKRVRLYFSGENIWTLTKLPVGFDPETATLGELGAGKSMFTQAIWAFGLNVSF